MVAYHRSMACKVYMQCPVFFDVVHRRKSIALSSTTQENETDRVAACCSRMKREFPFAPPAWTPSCRSALDVATTQAGCRGNCGRRNGFGQDRSGGCSQPEMANVLLMHNVHALRTNNSPLSKYFSREVEAAELLARPSCVRRLSSNSTPAFACKHI